MSRAPLPWLRALLAHGALLALGGALLVAVGQPVFTDDVWWHLGLGRAFAEVGPWLAEDPLLFDAAGPPSPSAWLFDRLLFTVYERAGFLGLRVLHVATVAALLTLAWSLLRRASGSAIVASAGTATFIALSTYRLVQLRPHLATVGLTLVLYRLLLEDARPPSGRRIAAAAALFALWANLHAAFPLGLGLVAAAAVAAAAAGWLGGDPAQGLRARRLGVAALAGAAAALLNPQGPEALAPWFAAGTSTPSLGRVIDEWAPVNPLTWPRPTLPPTPLAWALVWALIGGTLWLLPRAARRLRGRSREPGLDPARIGAAAGAWVVLFSAARFLWLGLLPLLELARAAGPRLAGRPRVAWALALVPALCGGLFLRAGDWPLVTRGLPRSLSHYAEPYAAQKYYPEPVWMLRDARVEGRLHCEYFHCGFVGFWLAPRVRTLVNGTLNVSSERLDAAWALSARRGLAEGESFPALLDRLGIDLFLGIRPPRLGNPWRPQVSTTAHLEDTPGWIPVFRNLSSAVYLRNSEQNRENRARVAAYYAGEGVPFDRGRGFEPLRVIREAPSWAVARGLIPAGFGALEHRARMGADLRARAARDRVASYYTALGLYEEAVELDRTTLDADSGALGARRRLVWCLLHLGRLEEAEAAAAPLADLPPGDVLSLALSRAPAELAALEPGEARARLATFPVFYRAGFSSLLVGMRRPEARTD